MFDVVLNCAFKQANTDGVTDLDKVVKALAYNDDNIDQRSDRKYRSTIALFISGAGVSYCAREKQKSNCVDTSLNSPIPLDMSWLRITKADDNSLEFGEDGYVQYFADRFPKLPVSGWRVTAGRGATTIALYWQFSVPITMVHGCPQIWSTFMTCLVDLQLIGREGTKGGWLCQTLRELGEEGTTLPTAFTPHAFLAIVL